MQRTFHEAYVEARVDSIIWQLQGLYAKGTKVLEDKLRAKFHKPEVLSILITLDDAVETYFKYHPKDDESRFEAVNRLSCLSERIGYHSATLPVIRAVIEQYFCRAPVKITPKPKNTKRKRALSKV